MKKVHILASVAAVLILAGCAPTFSRAVLDQVDRNITFQQLQADPDKYRGKVVMLGGVILETRNTPGGSFVEVLQRPLDRQARPRETDETEGRFIIESRDFLDAAAYYPGKRISVVGPVAGQEIRPLGGINYRYPVVAPTEIRLWEPRTGPQFSFGVGIGFYHGF